MEEKLNNLYQQIFDLINEWIPSEWLEAHVLSNYENGRGGSAYLDFNTPQKSEYININKCDGIADSNSYKKKLYTLIGNLRAVFDEYKQPRWSWTNLHFTAEGNMKADFDCIEWRKSGFTESDLFGFYYKKYLGIKPYNEDSANRMLQYEKEEQIKASVNDKVLGKLKYKHGWEKNQKLVFWGEEVNLKIKFIAPEGREIQQTQREDYEYFIKNIEKISDETYKVVIEQLQNNIEKYGIDEKEAKNVFSIVKINSTVVSFGENHTASVWCMLKSRWYGTGHGFEINFLPKVEIEAAYAKKKDIEVEKNDKSEVSNVNDDNAQLERAYELYGNEKYSEAFDVFNLLAEKNNAEAQFYLGWMNLAGLGVKQNNKKAIEWYKKSAAQGNGDALYNLGYCYQYGSGVEQNLKEAEKWYVKIAEQDNRAANNLGVICENSGDCKTAIKWYQKAAELGNDMALFNIGCIYYNGSDSVKQDYKKSFEYFQKAADKGIVDAQFNLGNSYYYARGVEKNLEQAEHFYRLAAEAGDASGQLNLGYLYEVDKHDKTTAIEWYKKSAAQGNETAIANLEELGFDKFGNKIK